MRIFRPVEWRKAWPQSAIVAIGMIALLGIPAAGFLKLARRHRPRILSYVVHPRSAPIVLTGGCSIFPPNNIWNTRVDSLPADANSEAYVQSIGSGAGLHADFGPWAGIPYTVAQNSPRADVDFEIADESDRGPYRLPENTLIEPASDGHALVIDTGECRLYELFQARRDHGRWEAGSGAIFDLRSNGLRPKGWTSADAAGLPMLPGLVRYEEVEGGRISHALRFTARRTRAQFVWPARHRASRSDDPNLPPMGQRFRLRKSFETSSFSPQARVLLTALKEYGMMLSDNGGPWFVTGAPDLRWSRRLMAELRQVTGREFEAVDVSGLMIDPDSGEARQR